MEQVSLDTFKEIINLLSLAQIRKLCQTNANMAKLCQQGDIQNYISQKIATEWSKKFSKPETALVAAAREGKLDELNALLRIGIDPTYNNNQALEMALHNKHTKIVRRLLLDSRVKMDNEKLLNSMHGKEIFLLVLNTLSNPLTTNEILSLLEKAILERRDDIIEILIHLENFEVNKLLPNIKKRLLGYAIRYDAPIVIDTIILSDNFDPSILESDDIMQNILDEIYLSNRGVILKLIKYPNVRRRLYNYFYNVDISDLRNILVFSAMGYKRSPNEYIHKLSSMLGISIDDLKIYLAN